ncbi:uncharacterized protein [Typha angustifolia]|uniref:uncharacterized protein n=1 Tax=Typha angustifolia TaxID=59011 RepID=UPI003C2E6648
MTLCPAPAEAALPTFSRQNVSNLRGVRWRVDLGILPSSPTSVEEFRRVAADSRRRYASLRRRLLVDPHLSKDEKRSPDPAVENPLSQNPDSMWGRFFRNAELEKMLDQDLSRLYPELGSYFQTDACQSILGHVLLVWCLRHPEYGYRQGMHELLAPLLYVLHIDVQHFSQVRALHEDNFNDNFDEAPFPDRELISNYKLKRTKNMGGTDETNSFQSNAVKTSSLNELDPDTRSLFLMNDAYGAEGELGMILSEKFMEHDAYCMFDGLMNGAHGVVAISEFFSLHPSVESSTGLTPVIEASSALYHLLSIVDSSLHSHLIELGVEPQYFALRWLRVLFGREFSLENLLVVWDEIFSYSNHISYIDIANIEYNIRLFCAPRGAFILSMAVSMLLHLRSSLLASEHATTCLQRLLNFPEDVNMKKLIEKARSVQALALKTNLSSSFSRGRTLMNQPDDVCQADNSVGMSSPTTSPNFWEEKWKVLHKAEDLHKENKPIISNMKKGSSMENLSSSAKSDTVMTMKKKKDYWSSGRHITFNDLTGADGISDTSRAKSSLYISRKNFSAEEINQNIVREHSNVSGEACLSADCSLRFSTLTNPQHDPGKSSSYLSFVADYDDETCHMEESCSSSIDSEIRNEFESSSVAEVKLNKRTSRIKTSLEEQGPPCKHQCSGKFNGSSDEEKLNSSGVEELCKEISSMMASDEASHSFGVGWNLELRDEELIRLLRSIGQKVLESIQVINSVFQQDLSLDSVDNPSNANPRLREQPIALAALKELKKIGDLLCEMHL